MRHAAMRKPRPRTARPGLEITGELVLGKLGFAVSTYFSGCVVTACWCHPCQKQPPSPIAAVTKIAQTMKMRMVIPPDSLTFMLAPIRR